MKFSSGIGVLLYWYDYGEAVLSYCIPGVFIDEENISAPFIAPENFDYPDWWYTWIDLDKIIRKLTRQDWALIIHYFKYIYQNETGTFNRWKAKHRFTEMCKRIYALLDADEYKTGDTGGYRYFERVLHRLNDMLEKGEIEVAKIEPHAFYTPQEVADILNYSIDSVYRMLQQGKIKGAKPGGHEWRVPGQSILDLFKLDPKEVD